MTRSSHSRASDTSSAYSGSDVMQSSANGDDCLMINNGSSIVLPGIIASFNNLKKRLLKKIDLDIKEKKEE